MKTVYSKLNCPACVALKQQLRNDGVEFKEVLIGFDISREDFMKQHPTVRSVPFVVDEEETA
jgi:glutaredoxin